MVCVHCMTYNHECFLEDALKGFVMQKTSFPFIIIVIDDCSTDRTAEVLRKYEILYPELIKAFYLFENHYSQKKTKRPYLDPYDNRSKYIALCEGDDYWTDPLKLQKQIDYMEAHPDCTLTVHSANWRTGDSIYPEGCTDVVSKDYSVEELIRCGGLHFATASFVFRTELNKDWPEWRRKANVGDFPLQILAGLHGNVHYLPDKMCVYRYRSEGSWSTNILKREKYIAFQKNKIEWMTLLDEATGHKYQRAIYDQLAQHFISLYLLKEISFKEYAIATNRSGSRRYGRLLKDFVRVRFPNVFSALRVFRFLKR